MSPVANMRMRITISLALLALLGLVILYVRHDDPPPQVDRRSFHCDPEGRLPCDGVRP